MPNHILVGIAMLFAILILLAMPFTDLSRLKGISLKKIKMKYFYVMFPALVLGVEILLKTVQIFDTGMDYVLKP